MTWKCYILNHNLSLLLILLILIVCNIKRHILFPNDSLQNCDNGWFIVRILPECYMGYFLLSESCDTYLQSKMPKAVTILENYSLPLSVAKLTSVTEVFRDFLQFIQANTGVVSSNRPRPLYSMPFPIRLSFIILPYTKLLIASLNNS
jgi:hypothetical protein